MRLLISALLLLVITACGDNKKSETTEEQKTTNSKPKKDAKVYADSAQYYWNLAIMEDSMMVDSALYMVNMAIKADSANTMHQYVKARYLSQMGFYNKALDIYKSIDAKHQVDFVTYNMIGMLYYRLNQVDSSKRYIDLSHKNILTQIENSDNSQQVTSLKMREAILLIMQDKKDEAIKMLENITPTSEEEAGFLNSQILELKNKTKDDIVDDMLPKDRSFMFERNKKNSISAPQIQ